MLASKPDCTGVACVIGALFGLTAVVVTGCDPYPNNDERWDDDIIATGYDTAVDFEAFQTFAIDPVVHIIKRDDGADPQQGTLDPKYGDPIVAQVVKNMTDRGYQQVDKAANPDLGITLTGINAEVSGSVSTWYGYGGYWGYGGWGYYYPYTYDYSYRTGSLVTEMVRLVGAPPTVDDAGVVDAGGTLAGPMALPVVWASVAYAVLDGETVPDVKWAKQSIDEAFSQSPYLGSK